MPVRVMPDEPLTSGDRRRMLRTVLGKSNGSWKASRREVARSEILRVAREIVREQGLAALSLRDLAKRVGMAAPSIYSYFDSKDAIYDAMFAQGYRAFRQLEGRPPGADLRAELGLRAHEFVSFCTEDPARYQLLFQRTIPGFEPSAASWALAQEAYRYGHVGLAAHGVVDQADLDMITAVLTGLADQQISNDPGGRRWIRLVDEAVDMLVTHLTADRRRAHTGSRAEGD
jgi:AcrR family transcriptional regulator